MDTGTTPNIQQPIEPGAERRRSVRRISGKLVVVKSSHGEREKALIRDVSIHGCCLVSAAKWLRSGSFITIVLSADFSTEAVVRWARNNMCGAEFLRPISSAQAEDLAEG